jgi:hypothetical protein
VVVSGEEVLQSYFPLTWGYLERQERCREQYGFRCACPRCDEEARWESELSGSDEDMVPAAPGSQNLNENKNIEDSSIDESYIFVFLLRHVCPDEDCGGTLAPVSGCESGPGRKYECNLCGRLRSEAEFMAELEMEMKDECGPQ